MSEYDSSLDDPSVLFVDGIGPIAQYHNYVDVAEEKGLHLFARDYRNWQNSKCKVEKMPPKNSYGKQRASWADIDDDARLDQLANREAQATYTTAPAIIPCIIIVMGVSDIF